MDGKRLSADPLTASPATFGGPRSWGYLVAVWKRLAERLTVRPILVTLGLVSTLVFAVMLFLATNAYERFSQETLRDSERAMVRTMIADRLSQRHEPLVLAMTRDLIAEPGFRDLVIKGDKAALAGMLRDGFRQSYVANRGVALLYLGVFDNKLNPIADARGADFAPIPWNTMHEYAEIRAGDRQRRVASNYTLDKAGRPVHVIFHPIGTFRPLGYLAVVTSPLPAIIGLARALGNGVTLISLNGKVLAKEEAHAPKGDNGATRYLDAITTTVLGDDGQPLFDVAMAIDETAYRVGALKIRNISYAAAILVVVAIWLAGAGFLRITVFKRIAVMSGALRRIAAGRTDLVIPPTGHDEIGRMAHDLEAVKGYVAEVVALKESLARGNAELNREIAGRNEIERALREAKTRAEAANRAKSEFLAMMSHELRTPLNAVIGFSEIISKQLLGPVGSVKYLEYAKDINDSGQHLLELINDILDLTKIESGIDDLHDEVIAIGAVLEPVKTLVKERAMRGGVILVIEHDDTMPSIRVDKRKLKQILVNLLSNAIKLTPAGGRVTVTAMIDRGDILFRVADTGIGMAAEDIPIALSVFGQVDSDLDRKYEGTGLGLPLTKALVEAHGGTLDLDSAPGAGTTVTVRFPADRVVVEDGTQLPAVGETG